MGCETSRRQPRDRSPGECFLQGATPSGRSRCRQALPGGDAHFRGNERTSTSGTYAQTWIWCERSSCPRCRRLSRKRVAQVARQSAYTRQHARIFQAVRRDRRPGANHRRPASDHAPVTPACPARRSGRISTLQVDELFEQYRRTLQGDRQFLFQRYRLADMARKVVGVGSVGTRCWIFLFQNPEGTDPLFLQLKEAQQSVLAPFAGPAGTPTKVSGSSRASDSSRLPATSSSGGPEPRNGSTDGRMTSTSVSCGTGNSRSTSRS